MRDEDFVAGVSQLLRGAVQGGVELDRAYHCDCAARGEVSGDCGEEVFDVYLDVDEDVEGLDFCYVYGDQAAMRVVDEDVAAQGSCRVVVDAAGAVRHIAHYQRAGTRAELGEDVGDGGGEEEEAFGHLEGDFLRAGAADAVDGFGDFEVVVFGQEGDGFVDGFVVQYLVWDVV